MAKRKTELKVNDRVFEAIVDAGLNFNSGYGDMFGSLARYARSVCPSDPSQPVDLQLLFAATEQGYNTFYTKYINDTGHKTLQQLVDAVGMRNLIKLD